VYDRPAAAVMARIRGNLQRAVELGRLMRDRTESAAAGAAVVERARCAAFVVDSGCRLRDANQQAVELFQDGPACACQGLVRLRDQDADARFRKAVSALAGGLPTDTPRLPVRHGSGSWAVSLAALPAMPGGDSSLLLPTRPMVLVLVRDLNSRTTRAPDLTALREQFGLTPAEVLFCQRLFKGDSVAEAAGVLGIAAETARNRIKAIFHKTGTHRQAELVLLLAAWA
jgi:DNA-binding CsgD family transcriptional regulator